LIVDYHRFIVKDHRNHVVYNLNLSIRLDYEKIFLASEIKDERAIFSNIQEGINKLTYSAILIYTYSEYYKFNLWLLDPTLVNAIETIDLLEKRFVDQERR
jgi:adenosine deaminase